MLFITVLPFVSHISWSSFLVSLSEVLTRKATPHRLTPIESDQILQRIEGIQSLEVFLYSAQRNQVTKHEPSIDMQTLSSLFAIAAPRLRAVTQSGLEPAEQCVGTFLYHGAVAHHRCQYGGV